MADFSTLAGLAKPTMMPTSPMGLGPGALEGAMYGTDKARQDAFLAEAAKEAKIKAAMEAMKAEEASLAQPGRMADIQLKNASSQDNLDAYNTDGMGRENAFGAIENKGLEQEKQMKEFLAPLFNAVGGEDEDKAREAYNMLITKVKKLKNVSFETMRKSMQAEMYGKTKADPKQINKIDLEEVKGENAYAKEYLKQQGATSRQEKELIMKREIAKLKAVNPSLHNFIFKETGGDLEKTFNMLMGLKAAGAIQLGQNQADQANAILPADKQIPNPRLAPALVSGSSSTAPSTKPKFVHGRIYEDASGNKAKWNGETNSWEPVK